MTTIEERKSIVYRPGDIVCVDSNGERGANYFGLVVDKDFWIREIEEEDVILPLIEDHRRNGVLDNRIPLRVLGTKFFRQYWKTNDDNSFEPGDKVVMHYRPGSPVYTCKINLRSTIELCRIDDNLVGRLLFEDANPYTLEALAEAKVVYDYLDGARFDSSKKDISSEDKFLRLLEQAIPVN